jgi:hypothetical protein
VVSRRLRRRIARLLGDAHRASLRVLGGLRSLTAAAPGGSAPTVTRLWVDLVGRLAAAQSQADRATAETFQRIVRQTLKPGGVLDEAERLATAQQILDALASQGITVYVDASGRRWDLASYLEMATRTAVSRALVHRQFAALTSQGHDTVAVASRPGQPPCPRCRPYDGTALSITGRTLGQTATVTSPTGPPRTARVTRTLAEAITGGLFHPNCRHSLIPIVAETATIAASSPPAAAVYEAEQRQLALERRVRAWHRREAAALTPQALATARRRRSAAQRASRQHAARHGLPHRPRRERTDLAR